MRLRSDGEETRKKILDAACIVFGKKDYSKATFTEIAEQAKVKASLISFHFRSKDDLYLMVWEKLKKELDARWPIDGGLEKDAMPENRLRAHIRASLNRHCDEKLAGFIQIYTRERVNPTGLVDAEIEKMHKANAKHMRTLIRDLLGEGADNVDIDLCEMSVTNQFSILRPPHPKKKKRHNKHPKPDRFSAADVDRLTDHITTFCLGGINCVRQFSTKRKKK